MEQKKDKSDYDFLMKQEFDIEDRMAHIYNERWKLNNENTKLSLKLILVKDQIRSLFGRFRIELKKDKE